MSFHSRRRGVRSPLVATATAALAAVAVATAPQAQAVLSGVSTVAEATAPGRGLDPVHGFPSWYADSTGTRLQLCIESELCLGGNNLPDPDAEASLETNFPDEAFYAVARAETALTGGGRIRWRAVLEGAFANEVPAQGDQMVFTRVQVTGDKINLGVYPVNTVLTFETPYGTFTAPVGRDGKLSRARTESVAGDSTNGFRAPLTETQTGFGPTFLRWDTGAPAGHIGNPAVLHRITGGVRNTFQVKRGTTAVSPLETRFEVAGQCFVSTCN
jgi:hypothetical protein